MKRYYLGVDGGQSSTTALVADESGVVLGRGHGGPCNHVAASEGRAKFFGAVRACLEQACREASLPVDEIEFASSCLGFSGGPADKEAYAREIIRSRRFKVTHDAEIALSGATGGKPGIIIIAGTGSMAFGRNAQERTARAGGWGYVFGDEGGAFDIVRRALRAALRFEEGWGPHTVLHPLLLQSTKASDANQLMHRFYTPEYSRPRIAAMAELVSRAAEHNDGVALELLRSAAEDLVTYVAGVFHHLFHRDEHPPVAHIGGVFRSAILRTHFADQLRERVGLAAIKPLFTPAAGAVLDAMRADGNESPLSNVPESEK